MLGIRLRWRFIQGILVAVAISQHAAVFADQRPNVIVILADDLGYADVSMYGGKIATPNIDKLAQSGVRFTDAHSPSSVCTPTRYGLLTGRYCWRSPLKQGVLGGLSPRLIERDRITLAAFLKDRGYSTACVGKWHLGMDWELKPGKQVTRLGIEPRDQVFNVHYDRPITNGPVAVGFDYFFGISASLDMVPYVSIENDRVTELPTEDREFLMMDDREGGGRTRKGPTAPGFDAADVLPMVTKKSIEVIERHRGGHGQDAKPFFLYVPLASPHTPILPTGDWRGQSEINPYADFVMQTDAAIGEMMAALRQAGMDENTLVIVTSDNGCSPQAKFEELARHDHFPSGPLRGHKADLFEGGHRVPMVVHYPKSKSSGVVSSQVVCLTDIFATVADLIGEQIPDNAAEDSFSFAAEFTGTAATKPIRDHLVSHSINGSFAIRQGNWKLLLCRDSGGWSDPRPKSPKAADLPARQLYNLATDLAERDNRIEDQPAIARELQELLRKVVRDGRSTLGEPQKNWGNVNFGD
ncbi:MAG TPA: arylsulfatase [Planctomycetaceae bacterium]|nr:arylsulfatase [Planctomycetaceae bacterium]